MTSNSLTENEEHGILSWILKTIFGLHASVAVFYSNMCGSNTFVGSSDPPLIPKSKKPNSGQLVELIVYIIPPE